MSGGVKSNSEIEVFCWVLCPTGCGNVSAFWVLAGANDFGVSV